MVLFLKFFSLKLLIDFMTISTDNSIICKREKKQTNEIN